VLPDAKNTRDSRHPRHDNWSTLGDIGYLDADGYLYLTDRRAFTIISGGVNIYPAEIESCLIMHPAIADVAVFGLPHDEMGEYVHRPHRPRPVLIDNAELTELARTCAATGSRLWWPPASSHAFVGNG
jgi:acyl-CoA synthetase (AMP-forming)/AMP-acid ligase II